jgi:3-oxoacyl-[acyl-carrier protein] reductase
MNQIDLRGRRAVITGGAEGFGRAIAERFLRSGAAVSLWDVNRDLVARTARELLASGPVHTAIADISDRDQVDAAVASTLNEWSGIDILIANAGLTGPNAPTWEYPPDEWRRVVDVNLVGTFYCCRAVAPIMLRHIFRLIIIC